MSEDVLYRYIDKHPGLSTYELSKRLSWEGGKVRTVLARLERAQLIKTKYVEENHKIKKISYPLTLKELVAISNLSYAQSKRINSSFASNENCGENSNLKIAAKHI